MENNGHGKEISSVYFIGKWEKRESIKTMMDKVVESGFSITHDWTKGDDGDDLSTAAFKDMVGVLEADAVIINWHPGLKGGLAELGAAIATDKVVVVINCPRPMNPGDCLFFEHEACHHVSNLDDAIAYLLG